MGLIKPKRKIKFNIKAFGIVFTAVGAVMVLFSVYLLIFGGKAEGVFTSSVRGGKSRIHNHYEYTVNEENYDYSERVSRDKGGREGDTVTVHYLKQNPDITYDKNALVMGMLMAVIGGFSIYAGKDNDKQ